MSYLKLKISYQKEKMKNSDRNSPLGAGGMQAMIFSAGLGTRFKPWTDSHPKALAVVNGKSLLQRNIEYLQQYGITDIVVNVHHFADQLINIEIGKNISIAGDKLFTRSKKLFCF